jgi:hypothetical protein
VDARQDFAAARRRERRILDKAIPHVDVVRVTKIPQSPRPYAGHA